MTSQPAEPAAERPRTFNRGESGSYRTVAVLLAVLWLAIPGIQYAGALQRTAVTLGRAEPGSLASLDLTPWYVLLLGATLLYAITGWLYDRKQDVS